MAVFAYFYHRYLAFNRAIYLSIVRVLLLAAFLAASAYEFFC